MSWRVIVTLLHPVLDFFEFPIASDFTACILFKWSKSFDNLKCNFRLSTLPLEIFRVPTVIGELGYLL